jgi:23S rRNA G2445 N2-methylase RlmL
LELSQAALADVKPQWARGTMVGNPPYGERLRGDRELPRQLARLVDRFADYSVGLLLAEQQELGRTRRKPHTYELFNGNIPCTLRTYAPLARTDENV